MILQHPVVGLRRGRLAKEVKKNTKDEKLMIQLTLLSRNVSKKSHSWGRRYYLKNIWNMAELCLFFKRPEMFCKESVLRNFTKFTGKHLCQSLFFNKVASLILLAKVKNLAVSIA